MRRDLCVRGSVGAFRWIFGALVLGLAGLGFSCADDSKDSDFRGEGDGDAEAAPETDGEPADSEPEDESEEEEVMPEPTLISAGYAEAEVTPPVGTVMGAYGMPGGGRRTEGTHDPLMAQALFLRNDAGEGFLLVAIDCAGYSYEFGDWGPGIAANRIAMSEKLSERGIDLPAEHILVSSSHSHSSADLVGFWYPAHEGVDKDLLRFMQEKLVDLADAAARNLAPAEIHYGRTELVGYTGRDSECSPVIDNSVNLMEVRLSDGRVLADVVNYAIHPTYMGDGNRLASADLIYGLRQELAQTTGGAVIYFQSFEAAVHSGPLRGTIEGEGFDNAYNMGKIIARTVAEARASLVKNTTFRIRHRSAETTCPAEGDYLVGVLKYFGIPMRSLTEKEGVNWIDRTEVSWHRVGDAEFAAFPGEGTPEYGLRLKERMVSPFQFTIGLANDGLGYLVDPESAAADTSGQLAGYELKMGLGPRGGPCVWDAHAALGWFDGGAMEEEP